jgi:hypothetical protein
LPSANPKLPDLGNVTRTPNGYDGDLNIVVNTKKLDKIQAAQRAILNFRAQNEFIRFDNPAERMAPTLPPPVLANSAARFCASSVACVIKSRLMVSKLPSKYMPTPAVARTTSTAVLTIKAPSASKSDWLLPCHGVFFVCCANGIHRV